MTVTEQPPTRRQYADLITVLVDEGMSASQIGQRLGMSRQRVMRIASQYRIRLQPRGGNRRIGAQFSAQRYAVIEGLAAKAGVSVGTMLARIAATVVDEGPQVASRRLGRQARPKRPYTRRQP